MKRVAIVIGATGLVGRSLVAQLEYVYDKLIVIARRPPKTMSEKMDFYQLNDFNNIEELISGINVGANTDAFSCLGSTKKQAGSKRAFKEIDYGYNLKFAKACRQKGVKHLFLLSALGANSKSPVFYNCVKGELEDAIKALGFEQLVIFQPSLLLGKHKGRPMERITQGVFKAVSPILPSVFRTRPICATRVAAAMTMSAQDLYERGKFSQGVTPVKYSPMGLQYSENASGNSDKNNKNESKNSATANVTVIDNKQMLQLTQLVK